MFSGGDKIVTLPIGAQINPVPTPFTIPSSSLTSESARTHRRGHGVEPASTSAYLGEISPSGGQNFVPSAWLSFINFFSSAFQDWIAEVRRPGINLFSNPVQALVDGAAGLVTKALTAPDISHIDTGLLGVLRGYSPEILALMQRATGETIESIEADLEKRGWPSLNEKVSTALNTPATYVVGIIDVTTGDEPTIINGLIEPKELRDEILGEVKPQIDEIRALLAPFESSPDARRAFYERLSQAEEKIASNFRMTLEYMARLGYPEYLEMWGFKGTPKNPF